MNSALALLIFLPLVEILSSSLAKNHHKIYLFFILFLASFSLVLSYNLNISSQIYIIDFGFIKLKFMCDIYAYFFGILVNIVWFITNLYSYSYATLNIHKQQISSFFRYLSLSIFAVFGICYAGDLITTFIFTTLLTLFTAPLIVLTKHKETIKAKNLYLLTHLGSDLVFMVPAFYLIYHYTGNLDFVKNNLLESLHNNTVAGFILFLLVFGLSKNCIIPFHRWLIKSTIAPVPVSGLLHSVAAVKSASIIILKIIVYIFGVDYIQKLNDNFFTGGWIFYLCGFTAIYAAYRALKTKVVKRRFAYSTVSQLSYILSSFILATPLAITAGTLHIISHSLCKIVLFYIAGIFATVYGVHSTQDAGKLAPNVKYLVACIAFCGASIIGFPLLPGSFGKDYMLVADWKTHHYSSMIFLLIGSFINVLYIYPIVKAGFFNKNPAKLDLTHKTIPLTMRIAVIIAISLAIYMSIFINQIISFFHQYV
jgi:multicomponent Na+:H+ antiporter subunit D